MQETFYQIGRADINGSMSQNTEDLYKRSDWMTTDVNTQITASALSLKLKHRLCKVTVKIVGFEGWDTNPTIENIRFFGKDNNDLSGVVTPSKYIDIIPLQITTTDNHTAYTAFISSYDYTGDATLPFMNFTIDNEDYIIYTPKDIGRKGLLELGNAYNFNLKVNLEIPPLIALLGGNIDLSNINEDPFSSFLVKTFIEGESINFDYITLIGLIITIIGFILIFILWNKKFLSLIGVVIFIIGDVLIGLEGFNFTILNKEFLSETINFLGIDILLNGEIIANGSIISSIIFVFIPLFSLINLFINIYNEKYKRKEIKST